MKFVSELSSDTNRPQLTPFFKKQERSLLSVFMRMLELVPWIRGEFFADCGFMAARTSSYESYMEVSYAGKKYPEGRPDGLVYCKRGNTHWAAFIEAKCGNSPIRPEQIQSYAELAAAVDVDAIISISNEFARQPSELPYHVASNKRKKRDIFHFSWSEIKNRLGLYLHDKRLSELEIEILKDCLSYFDLDGSGVLSYNQMPKEWLDFVQSAGVGVGFTSKQPGITEVVHGWHQERRDLCSKLMRLVQGPVDLKHALGARADFGQILTYDRKELAEKCELSAEFSFKDKPTSLGIRCELQDRKTTALMEFKPPTGKAAKGTLSWLAKRVANMPNGKTSVIFNWKGKGNQRALRLEDFQNDPDAALSESKDAPKNITIVRQVHDVRRFKSRKFFIVDLEATAQSLVVDVTEAGLF